MALEKMRLSVHADLPPVLVSKIDKVLTLIFQTFCLDVIKGMGG